MMVFSEGEVARPLRTFESRVFESGVSSSKEFDSGVDRVVGGATGAIADVGMTSGSSECKAEVDEVGWKFANGVTQSRRLRTGLVSPGCNTTNSLSDSIKHSKALIWGSIRESSRWRTEDRR